MVTFIDQFTPARFFPKQPPNYETNYESLTNQFGSINCLTNTRVVEECLEQKEVVSELLYSPDGAAQSNTLCVYPKPDAPDASVLVIRTAMGAVQTDYAIVNQRRKGLQERARLQKDSLTQEKLTLDARLEVETDRKTGRTYMMVPELAKITLTFCVAKKREYLGHRKTWARITMPSLGTLDYDLFDLSASLISPPQPFLRRKMAPSELTFLLECYQKALDWAAATRP